MAFLGYVIQLIGVALMFLAVVGAARDIFASAPKGFGGTNDKIYALALKVLLKFLDGPKWLMLLVLGLLLFVGGDRYATGSWFFNR